MINESIKAAQLTRRGVSDSPQKPTGKAENFKGSRVSKHAPQFAWLESNFALTDGGARSFPVEVEELPAERCWDAVPAHSESRRGRNMKRTFSPSLHLTAILSKSFCAVLSCRRPRSRCPASPAFDFLFFTLSSTSGQQRGASERVRWVGADAGVYIWCLVSLEWKLHLNLAYLFVCFGLPLSLKSTGGK